MGSARLTRGQHPSQTPSAQVSPNVKTSPGQKGKHRDIDLDRGLVHVAFNYVVRGGQGVRKDTKTHQDRWRDDAYLSSNDPAHSRPWNPDWVTHQIAAAADAAGVKLDIKGGRHYTASQLLAGGFDLRNTQRTIRKRIRHRAETRIAAADAYRIRR